jgi:hypothetical protein
MPGTEPRPSSSQSIAKGTETLLRATMRTLGTATVPGSIFETETCRFTHLQRTSVSGRFSAVTSCRHKTPRLAKARYCTQRCLSRMTKCAINMQHHARHERAWGGFLIVLNVEVEISVNRRLVRSLGCFRSDSSGRWGGGGKSQIIEIEKTKLN